MAKHNVYVELPVRELGKVDAHFYIYENDEVLGRITISKGSLDYHPANSKRGIKMNWGQFDRVIKKWKNG